MGTTFPPSFNRLKTFAKLYGWEQGHETLTLSREGFVSLIRYILLQTEFDEGWYLATYEDVAKAVAEKQVEGAWEHYITFGYFEGRLPSGKGFDPDFYAEQYPDVVRALKSREPCDLFKHFMEHGYTEGRMAAPAT